MKGTDENAITEEIKLELEELQEAVEVKTREANENLEKYCSLIVKYYKLEEANEMLKMQVTLLNGQLKQQTSDTVSSSLLNSGNSSTACSQSDKEMRWDEDTTKPSTKRQRCEDTRKESGEPRSPLPETSSKKKRKDDICQNLENQENSDYEPDGLPEVVKRGIYNFFLYSQIFSEHSGCFLLFCFAELVLLLGKKVTVLNIFGDIDGR